MPTGRTSSPPTRTSTPTPAPTTPTQWALLAVGAVAMLSLGVLGAWLLFG
jgi:hypothetical protein